MARLELLDGGWLELTPTRYQFDHVEDDYDANWLEIEFAADLGEQLRVSRCSAPALLSWELHGFARDLRRVLARQGTSMARLDPMEPNVAVTVWLRDEQMAEVSIDLALSFAPYAREPFDEPFRKTGTGSTGKLLSFVTQLERELSEFPVRAT